MFLLKFFSLRKEKKTTCLPEKTSVTLSSEDTMHERARKIWYLLGFVNDRFGTIDRLASYLYIYKDLDNSKN